MLYSVRSERLLMEEIDYSMLFRWFMGMNLDEHYRSGATLATRLCGKVFGFVERNLSGAQAEEGCL